MTTLSPLQQEFMDVLFDDAEIAMSFSEDEEMDKLIADIKSMNAAELRQNIKVFKETGLLVEQLGDK